MENKDKTLTIGELKRLLNESKLPDSSQVIMVLSKDSNTSFPRLVTSAQDYTYTLKYGMIELPKTSFAIINDTINTPIVELKFYDDKNNNLPYNYKVL